jgi:hypothetical protein
MIYNGTEEIANAGTYPKIIVFTAFQMMSPSPVEELLCIELNWSLASSSSIGWLYGRMIHQAFDGRQIGLIATIICIKTIKVKK